MAIYFIQAGVGGSIKIGFTNQPIESRLRELQTGNPYKLRVLFVYTGDETSEKELHHKHRRHRLCGEWFKNHKDIKSEINYLQSAQAVAGFKHKKGKRVSRINEMVRLANNAYKNNT